MDAWLKAAGAARYPVSLGGRSDEWCVLPSRQRPRNFRTSFLTEESNAMGSSAPGQDRIVGLLTRPIDQGIGGTGLFGRPADACRAPWPILGAAHPHTDRNRLECGP
jgi:hypothetical protein